jgi:hypothetical protein
MTRRDGDKSPHAQRRRRRCVVQASTRLNFALGAHQRARLRCGWSLRMLPGRVFCDGTIAALKEVDKEIMPV